MTDFSTQALELHKKYQGKLETVSKVALTGKQELSLVYTPGVGAVSMEVFKNPESVNDLTLTGRTVAIISDGTSVLGLGSIGPQAAMPVMEGKALLIKHFSGLDAFPLVINATEPADVVRFVKQVAPTFFAINLEDIKAPQCFEIEEALQDIGIPVFHDDQHGTAIVVAAALKNAAKVVGKPYHELKVAIVGAGAAGLAISKMLLGADCQASSCSFISGMSSVGDLVVFDSQGAIVKGRAGLNVYKQAIAGISNHGGLTGTPEALASNFDVIIGVSGPNTITQTMVTAMRGKPIVFALANPTPEIMPQDALDAGAYVVATGRSDFANQINNVLAFPAIFKIAHTLKLKKIGIEVKLALVTALASLLENPTQNEIIVSPFYPNLVDVLTQKVEQLLKETH